MSNDKVRDVAVQMLKEVCEVTVESMLHLQSKHFARPKASGSNDAQMDVSAAEF